MDELQISSTNGESQYIFCLAGEYTIDKRSRQIKYKDKVFWGKDVAYFKDEAAMQVALDPERTHPLYMKLLVNCYSVKNYNADSFSKYYLSALCDKWTLKQALQTQSTAKYPQVFNVCGIPEVAIDNYWEHGHLILSKDVDLEETSRQFAATLYAPWSEITARNICVEHYWRYFLERFALQV